MGNVFLEGRSVPEMLPGISRVMKHDAPAKLGVMYICDVCTECGGVSHRSSRDPWVSQFLTKER